MSIFATQPISVPPPSYSSTRHQPPSYVPSTRSLTSITTLRSNTSSSTTYNISAPTTDTNNKARTWLSSLFGTSPLVRVQLHERQTTQTTDSLPPLYKTTSTSPPSPTQPPPQYSSTLPTGSISPKPLHQIQYTETDFNYAEDEVSLDEREHERREDGEGEGGMYMCCNWFWIGPPSATSLPWEGWYVF